MKDNKVIGMCGLDPKVDGCNGVVTKNDLAMFNDKIKEKVDERAKEIMNRRKLIVVGWCSKCRCYLYANDIEDKEIGLLVSL